MTFLQEASQTISDDNFTGKKLVVTPNKRSLFHLRQSISNAEYETVDELMQQLSGLSLIEPEELLISFYQAYQRVEDDPQSFNEFSKWAVTFLSDVNEVDLYLQDADSLYDHISTYHTVGEGFEEQEPGALEEGYLNFWGRLPTYYRALKEDLKKIELSYRGAIYRRVTELINENDEVLVKRFGECKVYWLGIIPGNPCEHELLNWLESKSQLHVIADVDRYYLDRKLHEAGRPFREQKFLAVSDPVDLLGRKPYEFKVHPMTGRIAQVLKVKEILDNSSPSDLNSTVLVLADMTLLHPLSALLQDKSFKLNLTAGYPLKNTMIHRFHMSWINLHQTAIERNGEKAFYHKFLKEFFEFPVVQEWVAGAIDWYAIREKVVKKNIKYIPLSWLQEPLKDDLFAREALRLLFEWDGKTESLFQTINEILSNWKAAEGGVSVSEFERLCLEAYIEKLSLFLTQFNEVLHETNLNLLRQYIHRHMSIARVHPELEEGHGLQVMSLFETRLLDFDRVIFIGASDDHLPGNLHRVSHIPSIHRLHFGLPSRRDSESIFSYHFYRLLQRTKQVDFVYDRSMNAFSTGEPSRYITQLEQELLYLNKEANILYSTAPNELMDSYTNEVSVSKSPEIIESLKAALSRNLSASRINQFVNSPLEFYFYYILKVKEEEQVEEIIESSTFGNIIHQALEVLYKPFIGEEVNLDKLQKELNKTDEICESTFESYFEPKEYQSGQNLIALHVIKEYVRGFVEWDIAEMKKNGVVRLLSLELRMNEPFNSNGIKVNLYGVADRIDSRNGEIRIIDYKSGKVTANELAYDDDKIGIDAKQSKALQIALYIFLYCRRHNLNEDQVKGYVFSFRNQKGGYIPLTIKNNSSESLLDGFSVKLHEVINRMVDPAEEFEHLEDSKYMTV